MQLITQFAAKIENTQEYVTSDAMLTEMAMTTPHSPE